jgi:hypothetical protein
MVKKPVLQFREDGSLADIHNSIANAAKKMECDEATIRYAIKNNKNSFGFNWKHPIDNQQIPKIKEASYQKIMSKSGMIVPDRYLEQPEIIENLIKYGTEYDPKDVAFDVTGLEKNWEKWYDNKVTVKPWEKEVKNVLVVGDLHAPFIRKGYLDFCKEMCVKHDCNKVIFIGDLCDSHFSSFWNIDPDGHGAAEELRLAKLQIQEWHEAFPVAKVCIGNHDLIPARKAFNSGISKVWLKSISDILETPNWEYAEEFLIDEVLYVHGTGRKAANRMTSDLVSIVQGHYHSESYIQYAVGKFKKMFAMQIGCGVDDNSYAMAYGKFFDKMHINCGVVLENGELPVLEYMKL